mmetsp:Transcript_7106/g.17330  ORF Transcript_7106/g.17330 Transcript_7106/m.17330 type:complete len:218 (-) Transcript_7106:80-733(-)
MFTMQVSLRWPFFPPGGFVSARLRSGSISVALARRGCASERLRCLGRQRALATAPSVDLFEPAPLHPAFLRSNDAPPAVAVAGVLGFRRDRDPQLVRELLAVRRVPSDLGGDRGDRRKENHRKQRNLHRGRGWCVERSFENSNAGEEKSAGKAFSVIALSSDRKIVSYFASPGFSKNVFFEKKRCYGYFPPCVRGCFYSCFRFTDFDVRTRTSRSAD